MTNLCHPLQFSTLITGNKEKFANIIVFNFNTPETGEW